MNFTKAGLIVLRLFLGGMLLYGAYGKFSKPYPTPVEVVERASKFTEPDKVLTLQKILYISGMKQTGYAYHLLGAAELLLGLLLILQGTAFIAAVFSLPVTTHIFLFHVFLEADEAGELFLTGGMLLANILLIAAAYPKWKHLVWIRD